MLVCRGRGGELVCPRRLMNSLEKKSALWDWVRKKLCMVPCNSWDIYGTWRRKEVGVEDVLKSLFEVASYREGGVFMDGGRRRSDYVVLLFWNFIVCCTRYCTSLYRIPFFTILLLFYLLSIYWDMKNQ